VKELKLAGEGERFFSRRNLVQVGSLVINNSFFLSFLKFCPTPSLNCYACPWSNFACPIGSLQHFMVIEKIPYFLIGFFVLVGAAVGRMVCGWFCPAGWFQDLIYSVRTVKLRVRSRFLNQIGLVNLVFVAMLIPYFTKEPWFSKICFVGLIEGGIPLALSDPEIRMLIGGFFYIKVAITVSFLSLAVFVKRPFCRFFCPLGAIYSLFNRASLVRLEVKGGCIRCDRCREVCPMDIKVYEDPNSPQCIRCLACTSCSFVEATIGGKRIGG
jgi:ferredoxin-type protein NapH